MTAIFFKQKISLATWRIKPRADTLAKIIAKAQELRCLGAPVSGITRNNEIFSLKIDGVTYRTKEYEYNALDKIMRRLDVLLDDYANANQILSINNKAIFA